MAVRVAFVLRSGGEYRPEHVGWIREQVEKHLPGVETVCLSDVDVPCERIPLEHGWPGWWSKLELFRPDIAGDLLYLDLDTVVVGDLSAFIALDAPTMLSDFYWPARPASGLMFLPEACRTAVWQRWIEAPERHMARCGRLGDQAFLGTAIGGIRRFQDDLPGQVISYKVHVCTRRQQSRGTGNGRLPPGARVVCFHGKPRPWQVDADWIREDR